MLFFYVICGCLIFVASGLIMHFNRLAIYRRRIIRHFSNQVDYTPFILLKHQEVTIKQCFTNGKSIQHCIDILADEIMHQDN
jgi:hypothetical protein